MPNYVGPPISDPTPDVPADLGVPTPHVGVNIAASIPDPPTAGNIGGGDYRYQGWGQITIIETDLGLRQIAVAGPPGTPAQEVRVHGGRGRKIIQGVAIRMGMQPQIPSIFTNSANETPRSRRVAAFQPQQIPGGVRVYGFVWEYVYDLQVPFQESDSITFGQTPEDVGPAERLNPADYLSNLNAPSYNPDAFGGSAITF